MSSRIERQREYGQLKQKPTRNPLRAEKTPRINYNGFDYFPPPAKPMEEKWVYPESDWGLMAKFGSQKHIYDEIIATEKDYAKRLEECMKIKVILSVVAVGPKVLPPFTNPPAVSCAILRIYLAFARRPETSRC
jgi:hypothetical protein